MRVGDRKFANGKSLGRKPVIVVVRDAFASLAPLRETTTNFEEALQSIGADRGSRIKQLNAKGTRQVGIGYQLIRVGRSD